MSRGKTLASLVALVLISGAGTAPWPWDRYGERREPQVCGQVILPVGHEHYLLRDDTIFYVKTH